MNNLWCSLWTCKTALDPLTSSHCAISKDKSPPKGPGGDKPLLKTTTKTAKLGKYNAPTGPGGDQPLPKSTKPNVEIKPQNKKQDTKAFDRLMDIFRKSREIKRKRRSGSYV